MGRTFVVVAVLGIGIVGAAMFRKPADSSPAQARSSEIDRTLVLREQQSDSPVLLPTEIGGPQSPPYSPAFADNDFGLDATASVDANSDRGEFSVPVLLPSPTAVNAAEAPPFAEVDTRSGSSLPDAIQQDRDVSTSVAKAPVVEPPDLAPSFQQALPPLPELTTTTNRQPVNVTPPTTVHVETPTSRPFESERNEAEQRTYTIRDGDTLRRLAARHLGTESRAVEIFNLNREVLSSPELLPVGAVIRLPSRHRSTSVGIESTTLADDLITTSGPEMDHPGQDAASSDTKPSGKHPVPSPEIIWKPVPKSNLVPPTKPAPANASLSRSYAPELVPIAN